MSREALGTLEVAGVARTSWWRKVLRFVFFGACVGATMGAVIGAVVYFLLVPTIPAISSLEQYHPRLGTRIYSSDGQLVGEFSAERRVVVPYEKIPIRMIQAFMAAEDQRFFHHRGIDYLGVANAVFTKLTRGGKLRGASTITQQVAKSFLVEYEGYNKATERSIWRKAREAILARRLEQALDKEEILYLYLNQIFLGHRAYGVQAAAEHYYHKNVWDLSIGEMATLAGLPQRPSDYSPWANPKKAGERRKYVLRRMLDEGFITKAEQEQALGEAIVVYPLTEKYLEISPYFTEQVRREVMARYGEKALLEEGLQVFTTMDLSKQSYAQRAVYHGLQGLDKRQGFRGPVASVPAQHWDAFLDAYSDQVDDPPVKGKRYLALVTGFDYKEKHTFIRVGGAEGMIPLAAMRWARTPHSEKHYEDDWLEKPWTVLKKGDIVQVRTTSKRALANDRYAWDIIQSVPSRPEVPMWSLAQDPLAQGAALSVDARSGYVVAMVGGYDFLDSDFNRTVQACRQPGSAFKPIIYATAIDKKDFTPSTIIIDSPIVEDDPDNEMRWKPANAGLKFHGDTPIRTCLKNSMNICSIKVLKEVGVRTTIAYAHRLGITSKLTPDLSLALGSSCVSLWDLIKVYTLLNRYGEEQSPTIIKRITDRQGNVLVDNSVAWDPVDTLGHQLNRAYTDVSIKPRQLMDRQTAFIMIRMLHNVVQEGTAVMAKRLRKPAYGKTGTTNDAFDAWFMGFTEHYVTGVWVGHDRYERPLGVREYGGVAALPIWLEYMTQATKDKHQKEFKPPEGVVGIEIDPENGQLATPETPKPVIEYYRTGTEPREFSKRHTNLANENIYADDDLGDIGAQRHN